MMPGEFHEHYLTRATQFTIPFFRVVGGGTRECGLTTIVYSEI